MNRVKQHQQKLERSAIAETQQIIIDAKSNWLDAWMQKLAPAEIYDLAKTNGGADRKALRRWMLDSKIELHELPDRTELWKAGKKVGDFVIKLEGGKLNFLSKDYLETGNL